jgi:methyltransferase OMS1, mitochondrial
MIFFSGLNLDKYEGSQLSSLTLLDISEGMLNEAKRRVAGLENLQGVPVTIITADATKDLVDRFGNQSFDTVVDSFSLCVMGSEGAIQCLEQMSQIVKSTGQVLLLENSRSDNSLLGIYQDATAETAAMVGGKGCVYNQNVGALIRRTGCLAVQEERSYAAGLFRAYVCVRS